MGPTCAWSKPLAIVCSALLLSSGVVRPAHAEPTSSDAVALTFFKVLSYDRNLTSRIGDAKSLVIVLLYSGESSVSRGDRDQMQLSFQRMALKVSVQGLPVAVRSVDLDHSEVADRLAELKPGAVYLADGAGVARALAVTRPLKLAVLTRFRAHVEHGAAIGVVAKPDGRLGILVNLEALKACGVALDRRVLQLAELVK